MSGMSGAVTASPIAAPSISIVRLTIRTLTLMAPRTLHIASLLGFSLMLATIRLSVPGTLRFRDVAVRAVGEAARLVSSSDPSFDTAVIAAFAEIFNNVAIHAYQRRGGGAIEIAITPSENELVIEVKDHGRAFDLDNVPPLPSELDADSLPEG